MSKSPSRLIRILALALAAIALLSVVWLISAAVVDWVYDALDASESLRQGESSSTLQYIGAGGDSRSPARFFPPSETSAEVTSHFSTFTGLHVPHGSLLPPDTMNLPPFASVMPHMNNLFLRAKLGNSAWHVLHTMANSYPKEPSAHEKYAVVTFIRLLGILYPCGECASHLREKLSLHPPEPHVNSKDDLALYLCRLHNKVNLKLGHDIFDCSTVTERWKCGCGSADTDGEHSELPKKDAEQVDPEDDDTLLLPDGTRRVVPEIEKPLVKERRSFFESDYRTYVRRLIIANAKNITVAEYSTAKLKFPAL